MELVKYGGHRFARKTEKSTPSLTKLSGLQQAIGWKRCGDHHRHGGASVGTRLLVFGLVEKTARSKTGLWLADAGHPTKNRMSRSQSSGVQRGQGCKPTRKKRNGSVMAELDTVTAPPLAVMGLPRLTQPARDGLVLYCNW